MIEIVKSQIIGYTFKSPGGYPLVQFSYNRRLKTKMQQKITYGVENQQKNLNLTLDQNKFTFGNETYPNY